MHRRFAPLTLFVLLTLACALGAIPPASAAPAAPMANALRISQVYGGGGNTGAPYTHDFIEIFNSSSTTIPLNGLSLQYASATGTGNFGASATQLTELPDVTLQPGQYYLVQEAGSTTGSPLPTPDLVDSTPIAMSGTAGKVALVTGQTSLGCNGGSTPCSPEQAARIVDLVGYGSANYYEGTAAAPTLSNTTAALRGGDGCTDTDDNAADFTAGAPNPRNSNSAVNLCAPPHPKINEFSASTAGADVEYVEIYGAPNTDYSAYKVLEIEGDSGSPIGTVDEVISLGTTDANDLYLANLAANALENGTLSLLLVANFTGALNDDLDTDNDGVFDVTPWDAIVDAVAVNDGGAGDVTYGTTTLGVAYDGLPFAPGGASRIPDGFDTDAATDWVRNDFDLAGIPGFTGTPVYGEAYNTPGATNQAVPAGDTAPSVASTYPPNGAVDVALNTNLTITFSEAVNVTGDWFSLACSISGAKAAAVSGGPTAFTLNPDVDFAYNDVCTLTIYAANVTDQDTDDPPDAMAADYVTSFTTIAGDVCSLAFTPAYSIQGSGPSAAITGAVTTQGVVVGDYELPTGSGQIRGFYLQDLTGDGDATTSDGIFVYNGGADTVSVGQVVRVTGTAGEYAGQTQISNPTVVQCGTGSVTPVDITLPFPSADYAERYEGMLVRLPQTLYVTEHYQLGRFGQVVLTSRPDRLQQPTNVVAPGPAALALQAANNLDRLIVDDDNNLQNPDPIVFGRGGNPLSASNTLRGGDSAAGIVGVLVYDWAGNSASPAAYRVRPVGALNGGVINFMAANPRPVPPGISGRLRVTAANVLNYFNTFTGCTLGVGGAVTDCRGAENTTEFDRQWAKIVAGLIGTGADVIGLMEIENDGYGADSAIQDLVSRLNATTAAGTYAFIDADAGTGQVNALGTDAIKVGLIYKPEKVAPVGTTAALNTTAFVNGGDTSARNRPALAQAFQEIATGERFIVAVNHLKSKGSACDVPDAGDGQGNCNVVRTNAANLLTAWLAGDPTGTGDPDILIVGDLNSYALEDPITAIVAAGYTNLIHDFVGPDAYSYAFDGQWGYLDHALATPILAAQVTGVVEWHINADEPSVLDYNTNFKSTGQITSLYAPDQYRAADHDPVVIGLDLRDLTQYNLSNLTGYNLAWHTGDGAVRLGSLWAPGAGTADNDGVTRTPGVAWHAGAAGGSVDVTGTGGWLSAWIDWNDDGDFDDAGEQVLNDRQLAAGPQAVTFDIPAGTTFGRSFNARFRLYPAAQEVAAPDGGADGGEVEDYAWGFGPNAVGLAVFSAAPAAAAPSLAGLVALALAARAGAGMRRRRRI